MALPSHIVPKNRRYLRNLGYFEWISFHFNAIYMRVMELFSNNRGLPPFGINNVKIFCLNNGGDYLNVDRKLFIRCSPVFAEMIREKPNVTYLLLPVEYKVLRWCMRIVHGVSLTNDRPLNIRRIDDMFHLAEELHIDQVIQELLADVIEENLLYLTWNYKHREATRIIYDKHTFHEIGAIMHSEKFRGKKYTVPALDFAALWDVKVRDERKEVERITLGYQTTFSLPPEIGRCGKCPYCALANLPYSIAQFFAATL